MKKKKSNKNSRLQTRAELINRSRNSIAIDKLPEPTQNMFDCLRDFKQGANEFVDLSGIKRP